VDKSLSNIIVVDNLLEHFGMISGSTLLLRWAGSSCGYLGVSQNRESPVVAMFVSILSHGHPLRLDDLGVP